MVNKWRGNTHSCGTVIVLNGGDIEQIEQIINSLECPLCGIYEDDSYACTDGRVRYTIRMKTVGWALMYRESSDHEKLSGLSLL